MKRFTETEKWRDPWFRKLTAEAKLVFLYMLDNCDAGGVLSEDKELAEFSIGMMINWDEVMALINDRVEILPSGSFWIKKFISYQYGRLSKECKPHIAVFKALEKHGINPDGAEQGVLFAKNGESSSAQINQRVCKGYPKGMHTLEDIYKEKEKDKDKEKEGGAGGNEKPNISEVKCYAVEIGMEEKDGEAWHDHFLSNGWKIGGKAPMKDWRASLRTWMRNKGSFGAQSASTHREIKRAKEFTESIKVPCYDPVTGNYSTL